MWDENMTRTAHVKDTVFAEAVHSRGSYKGFVLLLFTAPLC
jgi:hypothetical protein